MMNYNPFMKKFIGFPRMYRVTHKVLIYKTAGFTGPIGECNALTIDIKEAFEKKPFGDFITKSIQPMYDKFALAKVKVSLRNLRRSQYLVVDTRTVTERAQDQKGLMTPTGQQLFDDWAGKQIIYLPNDNLSNVRLRYYVNRSPLEQYSIKGFKADDSANSYIRSKKFTRNSHISFNVYLKPTTYVRCDQYIGSKDPVKYTDLCTAMAIDPKTAATRLEFIESGTNAKSVSDKIREETYYEYEVYYTFYYNFCKRLVYNRS